MSTNLKIFLILFLLFSSNLYSGLQFSEEKLPTSNNLIEVEFFNSDIGIIITNKAEIFYTKNGGSSWDKSKFVLEFEPKTLIYLSNGEPVITGSKSTIIKSYDYGENWLIISHNDTSKIELNNIVARSPFELFITVSGSKILFNTVDGFQTISKVDYSSVKDFLTQPITYNKYDDYFYTTAGLTFLGVEGYSYRYKFNRYKTKHFYSINNIGYNFSFIEPIKNNFPRFEYLNTINGRTVGLYGGYIRKIEGDIPSPTENSYIYESPHYLSRFICENRLMVVIDNSGYINYLYNFHFDDTYKKNAKYFLHSIKVTDTTLFDYYQISQNKGIATSVDGKYYISDFSTSIENELIKDDLEVFPNPVNDRITIQFKAPTEIKSIQFFDLTGNLLLSKNLNTFYNNYTQSLKTIQSGVYFLKIITNKDIYFRKIIKF